MHPILKSWRIRILITAVVLAVSIMAVKGIQLGVDFSGGAVLTFSLDRPLSPEEMQQTIQIISQRVNWTGLSGAVVKGWGDQHVMVELSTADPQEIAYMREAILRQGKFETVVDGNVVLTGDEIIGVKPATHARLTEGVRWELPFVLSPKGVKNFYTGIKGKCEGGCEYSFMYIDRPAGSVLLIPKSVAEDENYLASLPSLDAAIGQPLSELIPLEKFIRNAGVKAYIVDENFNRDVLNDVNGLVILHPELNYLIPFLEEHNVQYNIVRADSGNSWVWRATNLRSVVRLTPGITNTDPARASSSILIEGWTKNRKEAEERVEELSIVLRSGALPAGIRLESEQRVPPTYGRQAFYTFLMAMLASMITVSLYIAWRYRVWKITGPIILTMLSETILIFGLAALWNWKVDVSTMVGMVAAIGTGVDDQIVITDEAIRRKTREGSKKEKSTAERMKRAFFIVFATAGALCAVMLPVWASGVPVLKGFALTTISGAVIGVVITRPAFAGIIRYIMDKD